MTDKNKEAGELDKQLEKIEEAGIETAEVFSKQPNTLLQNIQLWRQRSLWDIKDFTDITQRPYTHTFDNWLLKTTMVKWQEKPKDKEGFVWLSIADLGRVIYKDNRLNPDQYNEIKNGLLRVGGNILPFSRVNARGKFSIGLMQAVEVLFETNLEPEEYQKIDNIYKMGNVLLSLLKPDAPLKQKITRIGIKPNSIFIREIQEGGGQGYTNLKRSAISELRQLLGEAGTKWFDYIAQHRLDKGTIKLDTIIRRFNWGEKLKRQGKPLCLKLAMDGFKECIDVGQIYPEQQIRKKRAGSYYIPEQEKFVFYRTIKWVRKKEPVVVIKDDDFYLSKLRKIIKKNKWTIKGVADRLDVDRAYLSKILSGNRKGGEDFYEKVRELTG